MKEIIYQNHLKVLDFSTKKTMQSFSKSTIFDIIPFGKFLFQLKEEGISVRSTPKELATGYANSVAVCFNFLLCLVGWFGF